jgi:hypothetical protein
MAHSQRVHLHALLGVQRVDVGSIRATWNVKDCMALDAGQEKAAELKRDVATGQERIVCKPAFSTPANDFSKPEVACIKAAAQTWDSNGANAERRWLQSLIETLFATQSIGVPPRFLSVLCASAVNRILPISRIFHESSPRFQSLTTHPRQNPHVAVLSQNHHGLPSSNRSESP